MKILVIDDSGVMRRIHKNTLLEQNIAESDIIEATDGEEALKIAKEQDIGIFLVDWNMPKIDGLKLVQVIRAMDKYAETPIIMITSESAKYNVVEAINAGLPTT
ncbi:MAG: response regulator [Spirochaetia bacterium]|nr:response regulator [Spirochaetia bacterium]